MRNDLGGEVVPELIEGSDLHSVDRQVELNHLRHQDHLFSQVSSLFTAESVTLPPRPSSPRLSRSGTHSSSVARSFMDDMAPPGCPHPITTDDAEKSTKGFASGPQRVMRRRFTA